MDSFHLTAAAFVTGAATGWAAHPSCGVVPSPRFRSPAQLRTYHNAVHPSTSAAAAQHFLSKNPRPSSSRSMQMAVRQRREGSEQSSSADSDDRASSNDAITNVSNEQHANGSESARKDDSVDTSSSSRPGGRARARMRTPASFAPSKGRRDRSRSSPEEEAEAAILAQQNENPVSNVANGQQHPDNNNNQNIWSKLKKLATKSPNEDRLGASFGEPNKQSTSLQPSEPLLPTLSSLSGLPSRVGPDDRIYNLNEYVEVQENIPLSSAGAGLTKDQEESLIDFFKGVREELGLIEWPSFGRVVKLTIIVIVTIIVSTCAVYVVDSFFYWLTQHVLVKDL